MAIKLNINQILKKGDAKQRLLFIVIIIVALIFIFYFFAKILRMNSNAAGESRVSGVPSISSVQGGKVSPEYARALTNQNTQKVDIANRTGASAIPTLINTSTDPIIPTLACSNCCHSCGAESTEQIQSSLLTTGEISSATADVLNKLAAENLSPEDYEAALASLVREGKISPEEARRLLAAYKQNYQERIAATGASDLDPLIKQGVLSVGSASDLLDLQKQPASLTDYEQTLRRMVQEGRISPEAANLLLQKYRAQQEKRQTQEAAGQLASLVSTGHINDEVAARLKALQDSELSPTDYTNALNKMVAEGKISAEDAKRLLASYNKKFAGQEALDGVSGTELSLEQGDALKALQSAHASVSVFAAKLEAYARSGQISASTASRLLVAYQEEYDAIEAKDELRAKKASAAKDQLINTLVSTPKLPSDVATQLAGMRQSGMSLSDYAAELQRLVAAGLISPETAEALLASYQQQVSQRGFVKNGNGAAFGGLSSPAIDINLGGASLSGNSVLDRVAREGSAQQLSQTQQKRDYTAAAAFDRQNQQLAGAQAAQIQQLSEKMLSQAQQLFSPILSPVPQTMVVGVEDNQGMASASAGAAAVDSAQNTAAPIIKAGSVLYAVLDTAVDSDYAESPVMATVVSGEYKGAKLLGGIKTVKDGQRVMLAFNLMTMNDWPTGASVNAYAIDPDSARSALATSVDNHYLLRYGTLFASSFMQGLGQAVQESGTTVTSDSGVVTQSTSNLDTQQEILVALGQVGQSASTEVAKLQNTPPTVKVKAGVGIGILFMSDVSAVKGAPAASQASTL